MKQWHLSYRECPTWLNRLQSSNSKGLRAVELKKISPGWDWAHAYTILYIVVIMQNRLHGITSTKRQGLTKKTKSTYQKQRSAPLNWLSRSLNGRTTFSFACSVFPFLSSPAWPLWVTEISKYGKFIFAIIHDTHLLAKSLVLKGNDAESGI